MPCLKLLIFNLYSKGLNPVQKFFVFLASFFYCKAFLEFGFLISNPYWVYACICTLAAEKLNFGFIDFFLNSIFFEKNEVSSKTRYLSYFFFVFVHFFNLQFFFFFSFESSIRESSLMISISSEFDISITWQRFFFPFFLFPFIVFKFDFYP